MIFSRRKHFFCSDKTLLFYEVTLKFCQKTIFLDKKMCKYDHNQKLYSFVTDLFIHVRPYPRQTLFLSFSPRAWKLGVQLHCARIWGENQQNIFQFLRFFYLPLHKQLQTNNQTSRICSRMYLVDILVAAHPQNNNLGLQEKTLEDQICF